jgi:hypothetical protein
MAGGEQHASIIGAGKFREEAPNPSRERQQCALRDPEREMVL